MANDHDHYWLRVWRQFCKHTLGKAALVIVILFCLAGIYAPFLAASKPFIVQYNGEWFFPLFRYLFYQGYYTKRLDIFFNLLIFTFPAVFLALYLLRDHKKGKKTVLGILLALQIVLFIYFAYGRTQDPAFDLSLSKQRQEALLTHPLPSWDFDLRFMNDYARLNLVLRYQQRQAQQNRLQRYASFYDSSKLFKGLPTLWQEERDNEQQELNRLKEIIDAGPKNSPEVIAHAQASMNFILDKRQWLEAQQKFLRHEVMPLVRPFHWEDDAGGDQSLNKLVPFWELTRINRKDLMAALIFGIRISLVVGILSVGLALCIGIPIGALAGYYGGTFDIIVSRLLEIWEAMPTFFMLLMIVAITQSKSIFLVIAIIGIFGWTSFSRYLRGEFFKQRNLPYIEACRALGFNDSKIIFSHILPNAIPPVLTLLPFAIMGAITSEAGLSFLGLGEEGSCSWGVLMDEGRTAFPSESYLLWPPAILLTVLLVAIAIVGDAFRDALDPKTQR